MLAGVQCLSWAETCIAPIPQGDRDSASQQLQQCRQQLAELREQYDKHLLEVQAAAKTQQAASHEERLREKAAMKDQYEK